MIATVKVRRVIGGLAASALILLGLHLSDGDPAYPRDIKCPKHDACMGDRP